MKIPFLRPVVPPHVFCLLAEGVTYASVRRNPPRGFAQSRYFPYPPNTLGTSAAGTPLFSRESVAQAVEAGRRLSEGRLTRASVLFPDSWARILPIEVETLPEAPDAAREMVLWKLKKLLPGMASDLSVVYREMAASGGERGERRLLVAAAPTETLRSIEQSFDSLGVRVGTLAPFSLALFEGLSPLLSSRAAGDYALLHRSADSFVFLIASDGAPVFFRQRPVDEDEGEHDQEVRLSLSYYAEKLKGAGLAAVYVHDARGAEAGSRAAESFAVPVAPISARLVDADGSFDERVAARPELTGQSLEDIFLSLTA